MKFHFDTINGFGHITNEDFIHNPIVFIPEYHEMETCLERGLLPDEANGMGDEWFAARSCRIDVSKFIPTKTSKKLAKRVTCEVLCESLFQDELSLKLHFPTHDHMSVIKDLYKSYCEKKGFYNSFSISLLLLNNSQKKVILLYKYEERIIGCVICRIIGNSLVSLQFITDYSEPKLSLGNVSQFYEIELCKQLGLKYCYLMPAYEKSCLYKANFSGVEFYTGKEWSDDTELLKKLMLNDEQVIINDTRTKAAD